MTYDGHSLTGQIDQVTRLTGTSVTRAYVDRGYRGHKIKRDDLDITISHTYKITSPTIRREMRRRSAIEPVIGHLKEDGLLERNYLAGPEGDATNAIRNPQQVTTCASWPAGSGFFLRFWSQSSSVD